jgi:integrase
MSFSLSRNSIIWQVSALGKRFKISTGITTSHWVPKEQRVSKVEDFAWEKNSKLDKIEREEERIKVKAKVEGVMPDRVFLEAFVKQVCNPNQKVESNDPIFIWEVVELYRDRMKNTKEQSHLKNFKSLGQLFKDNYPLMKFDALNTQFYQDLTDYLIDEELLHNTIVRKMREIRAVANFARRIGLTIHVEYTDFKIKERRYNPFYLDWDLQLSQIEQIELEGMLDKVRDRFLFRCYTGMREGELNQLLPQHFSSRGGKVFLKYQDIKGKKPKSIQLNPKAEALAKKYSFMLPVMAQQTENWMIKDVGELAGLTQPFQKVRHSGNRVKAEMKPIYKMISSHTARRTFARRWFDMGGSLLMLSKYLGHSSIAVTELYIGIENEEANDEMMRIMG